MASTWSLVVVVIATDSPAAWRSIHMPAIVVEVLGEGAGDDPPVGFVGVEGTQVAVAQLE